MIRTATEAPYIPVAKPKVSFRPALVFVRDLCHHLNRYLDAAHKVHVPEENNLRRSDERPC